MYKLEIVTAQRDKLLSTLEQLTKNMDDKAYLQACLVISDIKQEIETDELTPVPPSRILKGEESNTLLWELIADEQLWFIPEYRVKGIHTGAHRWVAWDNSIGQLNVENFKTEEQAIAWLNDEEI